MPYPSRSTLRKTILILLEGGLCIAAAMVLSRISLFSVPQGGNVDLELAPLIFFTWRRGALWGCGVGALSGLCVGLLDPYIYNLAQGFLDYPLAYACVGLTPLFRRDLWGYVWGLHLAGACNLLCHVASGVLFFAQYAPEGQSPLFYSLIYNASFLLPKYVLSGIVAWILLL